MSLDDLRRELEAIDVDILRRVAERQRVAKRIDEVKARDGLPIRDFAREREVLERGRVVAAEVGLNTELAQEILAAQGYRVGVVDPAAPASGLAHWKDWHEAPPTSYAR